MEAGKRIQLASQPTQGPKLTLLRQRVLKNTDMLEDAASHNQIVSERCLVTTRAWELLPPASHCTP